MQACESLHYHALKTPFPPSPPWGCLWAQSPHYVLVCYASISDNREWDSFTHHHWHSWSTVTVGLFRTLSGVDATPVRTTESCDARCRSLPDCAIAVAGAWLCLVMPLPDCACCAIAWLCLFMTLLQQEAGCAIAMAGAWLCHCLVVPGCVMADSCLCVSLPGCAWLSLPGCAWLCHCLIVPGCTSACFCRVVPLL